MASIRLILALVLLAVVASTAQETAANTATKTTTRLKKTLRPAPNFTAAKTTKQVKRTSLPAPNYTPAKTTKQFKRTSSPDPIFTTAKTTKQVKKTSRRAPNYTAAKTTKQVKKTSPLPPKYTSNPSETCCLPKVRGLCKAYMPSWYYNSATKQCEKFIYGGCGGNDNRFTTKEKCEEKCYNCVCPEIDVCSLPWQTGTCKAKIPRWYFNSASKKCEEFIYGGCGGNGNRFLSKEACEKKCCHMAPMIDVCSKPKVPGPCRGSMNRWWYDSSTNKCILFTYGGCQGNDNNFLTEEDCQKRCVKSIGRCKQPKDVGPCEALIPRYYFDYEERTCVPFTYGGCKGNKNNFMTADDCIDCCC